MCSGVLGYLAGSHPSRGAWIEIMNSTLHGGFGRSHPSRGAWIEICFDGPRPPAPRSRTPHGVRGLKCERVSVFTPGHASHPSRGAWIEIGYDGALVSVPSVAPLTGCVD